MDGIHGRQRTAQRATRTRPPKDFTPFQKTAIVLIGFGCIGGLWYFFSGQAATGFAFTLTSNPNLERGLVGHWTFDGPNMDTSSTTAEVLDRSGNGNHGNWIHHATTTTPGPLGQALKFDGIDDLVNVGDTGTTAKTIAFCVKANPAIGQPFVAASSTTSTVGITSLPEFGTNGVVTSDSASRWAHAITHDGTYLYLTGYDGTYDWRTEKRTMSNGPLAEGGSPALTATGFPGATVYVDSVVSSTLPDNEWHHVVITDPTGVSAADVLFAGDGRSYFDGSLDDVRIYDRALTPTEIKRLYDLGATTRVAETITSNPNLERGLVGHWTFDGPDMNLGSKTAEILDRSGNNNHGDWINHATTTTPGTLGQAITLDGIDDYVPITTGTRAPQFIQEAETAWNTGTDQKTTASFDVQAGDVLVAYSMAENCCVDTVSISGGSLSWTNEETIQEVSYTQLYLWTTTVDTDKSMAVTFDRAGSTYQFGGNVLTFRGSDGAGSATSTYVLNGAPTLDITTTATNGAIVVASGDWEADNDSSRTWRTDAGPLAEQTYYYGAGVYTVYGGYHADAGNPGTYAVGLSAPGSQRYSIGAVEVLPGDDTISGIKTIAFWAKMSTTTLSQKLINIDGTDKIETNGDGEVVATSFPAATVYVNGATATSSIPRARDWHHVAVIDTTGVDGSELEIGRVGTTHGSFSVDGVRIYDRALTPTEIKRLYDLGR